MPVATRPLEAQVIVRMAESGGRAVERKLTLPVAPQRQHDRREAAVLRPLARRGRDRDFRCRRSSRPTARRWRVRGLRYELLKIESRYQWYRRDGSWDYEPIKPTRRVADGQVDVAADKPGRIAVPVQWGRYRLEVSSADADGPVTSIAFDAGWYTEASADTPDMLEIALDKPEYKPGETMTVAVTARTAGRVTLNVIGDRLISSTTQEVQPGVARLRVPVGTRLGQRRLSWSPPCAVRSTPRRSACRAARSACNGSRSTARPNASARHEPAATAAPEHDTLRVPVKVNGLAAGEDARIVVAAVDLGILNLTNYKPPAPDDYYLGQRRLTAEMRDLYGQLIDGMQGTRGQIRTGGDAARRAGGSPPSQKPLALYSGIVTVKPDGTAEVSFDIPAFAGTVRVMAVAWSKDKVGRADGDVTIRDPVVLTATLPRFLLTGDRGSMHLELDNVEGPAGEYSVAVSAEGAAQSRRPAGTEAAAGAKQRTSMTVPVSSFGRGRGRHRSDRSPVPATSRSSAPMRWTSSRRRRC